MDTICCFYPFVYYIYLASVVVGFGSFAVLGCKDLWNNANHLAKWYGHVMQSLELRSLCVSLKIIAHLTTLVSQSDSSIQRPRSIKPINAQPWIISYMYMCLCCLLYIFKMKLVLSSHSSHFLMFPYTYLFIDRCMPSINTTYLKRYDSLLVWALNLTVQLMSSRVKRGQARFGLHFKARSDL